MARNQPFDFSDDDDLASGSATIGDAEFSESGSTGMPGMTDDIGGEAAMQTGAQAGTAAEQAAQQTQTATRSSSGQQDTPTTMQHKRGNQPR